MLGYAINGKRFAGLKIRGFYPIKVFNRKTFMCLTFKALKQHHYKKLANTHSETFVVQLRTAKTAKVLAQ